MITPPITVITHCVVAVAAAAGAWVWQANSYEVKLATLQTQYAQAQYRAVENAHADTIRLQAQADAQTAASAARYRALVADRDKLRDSSDRLRTQLADAASSLSAATCGSTRAYAATLGTVFGECAAAVERLAGQADGHAIDAARCGQR